MLEIPIVNLKPKNMKAKKLLFGLLGIALTASSCYTEILVEDDFIVESSFNTDRVLQSYDLWYVDINATRGNGEVPFLQRAFTISFDNGLVLANNNIVGIGDTGAGLGITIGAYATLPGVVEIDHEFDGFWALEVLAVNDNTLQLFDPNSGTSYFLNGYQWNNFDYDRVFYENIDYLLQEYDVWEKTFTSELGAVNEFDDENYLQFVSGNNGFFRSSVDKVGIPLQNIQWDYEGDFEIFDTSDETLKTLTLDYDFLGNDYFELYVINDSTIELFHVASETVYEFTGRGFIQFSKTSKTASKKRIKTAHKKMNVTRKRKM